MIKFNSVEYTNYLINELENISLSLIKKNPLILEFIDNQTKEMCLNCVNQYYFSLKFVNHNLLTQEEYKEVCIDAVKRNECSILFVNHNYLTSNQYEEVCLESVKSNGSSLDFIKENLINNSIYKEICLIAIKQNAYCINYISSYLNDDDYSYICSNININDCIDYINPNRLNTKTYNKLSRLL